METEYDFEISKIIKKIKKTKAKRVLLQFPEGLKPKATEIVDEIQKQVKDSSIFVWLGSCFGACDVPLEARDEIDLLVQFGHSKWK